MLNMIKPMKIWPHWIFKRITYQYGDIKQNVFHSYYYFNLLMDVPSAEYFFYYHSLSYYFECSESLHKFSLIKFCLLWQLLLNHLHHPVKGQAVIPPVKFLPVRDSNLWLKKSMWVFETGTSCIVILNIDSLN